MDADTAIERALDVLNNLFEGVSFDSLEPFCLVVSVPNAINADYKSMLLKRAAQSLLLIDKSKFNRSGEARIGHLDEVTHIISDERQVATSLVTA